MPDFEALIKHQQLKQSKTNQRLKVVDSPDFEAENGENAKSNNPKILNYFIGGFLGSLIGTFIIIFLYINNFLPIDLLKIY
tara:strand:+ start:51 stop:293 length:243 start_codon:yes stop_codon:yes gene_type:complete